MSWVSWWAVVIVLLSIVVFVTAHRCVAGARNPGSWLAGGWLDTYSCVLQGSTTKIFKDLKKSLMTCRLAALVCDRLRTCVDGKEFVVMVLLTVLASVILHVCVARKPRL